MDVDARTVRDAVDASGIEGERVVLLGAQPVDDLDVEIPDGLDVTVAPKVGDPVTFIVLLAINIIAAVVNHQLSKKAIGAALDGAKGPDDNASPTYGWNNALSTVYGPGHAIPIVLGKHRVGGAVTDTVVEPATVGTLPDVLRVRQVLCEGPIHAIGGLSPPFGELDDLGTLDASNSNYSPIPAGLKLNGVTLDSRGTQVSIRLGYPHQSRLPRWSATATTLQVGAQLEDAGQTFTFFVAEPLVDSIVVAINFQAGLYLLSGSTRVSYPVTIRWRVRQPGGPWTSETDQRITDLRAAGFVAYHRVPVQNRRSGPYEVQAERITAGGDPSVVVSSATWVTLRHELSQSFTYAGRACQELTIVASERNVDSQPNITAIVDGLRCDVIDWSLLSHPPYRNPACQLTELLLNEEIGVGHLVKRLLGGTGAEEVRLDEMKRWAVFCDQDDPEDPGQPMHRSDLVFDAQAAPLEHLLGILRAGRGMPVHDGSSIWVVYEYRDAHSRGSVSVPARTPAQVITSSQVESSEMRWVDPANMPARMQLQYFDEARDWQPDEVPVLDPDRTVVRPDEPSPRLVAEAVNFRGVTRRHAVRREGWFALKFGDKSRAELSLTAGLQQISVTAGNLFWWVSECWWPAYDQPTASMHTLTESPDVGVSSIILDRDLTVTGAARSGTGVFVLGPDGVAQLATVDLAGPATIAAGDPVPLWDPAASMGTGAPASVKCRSGSVVATGVYGTFRRKFRVTSVKVTSRYRVTLTAILWDESMFDAPPSEQLSDWGAVIAPSGVHPAPVIPPPAVLPPVPAPAAGAAVAVGIDKLSWQVPAVQRGERARVWARQSGTGAYQLLGESSTGELALDVLPPGVSHDVVVLLPTTEGAYASPYEATPTVLRLVEHSGPKPATPVVAALASAERIAASWSPVTDAVAYEIRRGATWDSGEVAQVPEPRAVVDAAEVGEHRLIVRARTARGTLGAPALLTVTVPAPLGTMAQTNDLPATGTHDGTVYTGGDTAIELAPGVTAGSYTTPELDAGKPLELFWSALIDWHVRGRELVAELAGVMVAELGTVGCARVPSRLRPGVSTSSQSVGSLSGVMVSAVLLRRADAIGRRGDVLVEARWHDGTTWGAWERYRPQRRKARRMQARITILRDGPSPRVLIDRLLLTATP